MRALIVGATGFVGRRLATELLERGHMVSCMVRDRRAEAAREIEGRGCDLRQADLSDPATLAAAVNGIEVVYYLAHLMSAGGEEDLVTAEETAARALAGEAKRAGVRQMVYLGGLGDPSASRHLRARHRSAEALREHGPPLTYFRAAMVVGGESEAYVLLRSLVERLPAMVSPEWLENRTQPIGVDAIVEYLAEAPFVEGASGREVQLGGPEVMTYSEMVEGMAAALGDTVPIRLPTPRGISSHAVGKVAGAMSEGSREVAEHITAGLATDTVVEDPSGMELFDVTPEPYRLALARAIDEELRAAEGNAAPAAGGR
jgi:uncharacterized protein YbjT (DUF2867 family)